MEVPQLGIYRRCHLETGRSGDAEQAVPIPRSGRYKQEGFLCCRGCSWGVRGPNPIPGSQPHPRSPSPGFQGWEQKSPKLSGVETSRSCGWVRQRACGVPGSSSKRANTQTYSESLPLSSSAGTAAWKAPGTDGEELSWGTAFSQTKALAEAIVHLKSPSPTEPAGRQHIWISINLAITVCPTLVIPETLTPPNLWAHLSCFQWLFHMNGLSWPMLQIFLKSLKFTASGLSMPHTSY